MKDSSRVRDKLTLKVEVNGVPVHTLVDTGAEVSCMDKATFNKVFKNRRVRFRPSGPIIGITGNTMKCHGEVDAVICNTTVPIRILETQNAANLIMGMNILGKLDAKINCKAKSITLNGIKYYHKDFVPNNEAEMNYTSP